MALKNPKTLPKRLLLALADLGVDQLIGKSNDLVVDTASMSAIDLVGGTRSAYVQDSYTFDREAQVFHTIYFHQQQTCELIGRWLGLAVTGELTQGVVPASDAEQPDTPSVLTVPDLRVTSPMATSRPDPQSGRSRRHAVRCSPLLLGGLDRGRHQPRDVRAPTAG